MTLWYIARAAGIMALLALTLSVALGAAGASSRARGEAAVGRRFALQRIHLAAAVTALGLLATHLLSLALDTRTGMSRSAIVIPLASAYRPVAVALGVLAMYTVVLVGLSGAVRGRMASGVRSARRWRSVHALSYVGWTLAVAHGAFAGSDTLRGPMPLVYLGCVVTVGAAYAVRIHREHAAAQGPLALGRARSAESLARTVR